LTPLQLVHLDSRHTEAAIVLAREANHKNVFVSLDVEKNRLFLADLIPLCDIFFTNKEFPEVYFKHKMKDIQNLRLDKRDKDCNSLASDMAEDGSTEFLDTLLAMSFLFYSDRPDEGNTSAEKSRAEIVVTTRGSLGSLLMRRKGDKITSNRSAIVEVEANSNSNFVSENMLENAPIQIDEFLLTRQSSRSGPDNVFEIIR
jgi:sugar/nucleoside kinase (ribokinase family)